MIGIFESQHIQILYVYQNDPCIKDQACYRHISSNLPSCAKDLEDMAKT